jgi:pimeloyl-ACP methyl ester carboxylesterase
MLLDYQLHFILIKYKYNLTLYQGVDMKNNYLFFGVIFLLVSSIPFQAYANNYPNTAESIDQGSTINILFLHGMPATLNVLKPLREKLEELLSYENVSLNWWYPLLPDFESLDNWADNVVDEIDEWSPNGSIVIIGLSMGGKVALHTVSQARFGIQDKVELVITINSPIKKFQQYYNCFFGYKYPKPLLPFMATWVMGYEKPDGLSDVIFYDSTSEAEWVASEKSLLTFVSGEKIPNSPDFNEVFGDMFPRDCDDGIIPMSAQYISSSTMVYYGQHQHEAVFRDLSLGGARDDIAENITQYLLGQSIQCSVVVDSGYIHHQSDMFSMNGSWSDSVGEHEVNSSRDHFLIQIQQGSSSLLTGISKASWLSDDPMNTVLDICSYSKVPFGKINVYYEIFGKQECSR